VRHSSVRSQSASRRAAGGWPAQNCSSNAPSSPCSVMMREVPARRRCTASTSRLYQPISALTRDCRPDGRSRRGRSCSRVPLEPKDQRGGFENEPTVARPDDSSQVRVAGGLRLRRDLHHLDRRRRISSEASRREYPTMGRASVIGALGSGLALDAVVRGGQDAGHPVPVRHPRLVASPSGGRDDWMEILRGRREEAVPDADVARGARRMTPRTVAISVRCGPVAVSLAASVACSSRVSRVLEDGVGTSLDVIVAAVGPPDRVQQNTDALRSLCPAGATRIAVYQRRPLVPWIDEGAVAVLCVDASDRVIATPSSSPW